MTTTSLQKLEGQITCSVCLDRFTDPKLLQCHHVYCKGCLEGVLKRALNKAILICPACRKETLVPQEGGISGLVSAFFINELMELRDSLHREVASQMSSMSSNMSSLSSNPSSMGDSLSSVSTASTLLSGEFSSLNTNASVRSEVDKHRPPSKPMCKLHDRNELQLYCKSCDEVICIQCTILVHNGHKYELVKEVVGEHKHKMASEMEKVNAMATEIKKTLDTVDARNQEVGDLRTSIEGDIHNVFQDLHEMLGARENELVHQLDKITNKKLKILAEERDIKETVLLQANSCARQVEDALQRKSDTEVLLLKKTLMQRLKETVSLFHGDPNLLKVNMEADMVLSVPPDFAPQCKGFGHILTPESIDPQKCVAKGRGVEEAIVDKKAVIFMKVQDLKGNPFMLEIPDMECKVIFMRTGHASRCEVHRQTENVYEISYTPIARGAHEVHIKVDSMHVRGSPFSVIVRSPVENLGKLTNVLDNMVQPWGIVINQKEQIVISECDGHKVSIFGQDGTRIRKIGTEGGSNGKPLKWPRGIALDGKGNIFVAEMGNHRVQKFSEQGKLLASGGSVGKGREQFQDPKGLAYNFINNKVYVADVNRVQVMNSDLTFHDSFGKQGSGEGQFSNAFSIACDNRGNVFVSDKDNRNIQVFTAEGQFLKTFLSRGRRSLFGGGAGKVDIAPVGLAIDPYGRVYVSDNNTHRVSVFSPEGVCVTTIGKEGYASGEFKLPRGIAVTEGGVIYVCDFENDRVQVF